MRNHRSVAKLVSLVIVVAGLVFVAPAGAYKLPIPPGKPGGPPTKPKTTKPKSKPPTKCKKGKKCKPPKPVVSAATKAAGKDTGAGATALGTDLAGYTASELASIGSFKITVNFPASGTMLAKVSSGRTSLGQGYAGRANKGSGPLTLNFSAGGKAFLASHTGKAVPLTVKMTFVPNNHKNPTVSSTVSVSTFP